MLQFVNPALLIGAALLAVPLIIHLLNRQRFRRRRWAAMEFLLAAYKKQRRRLRRENLILLLLRCLIPVLLALAIARPLLREDDALGTGGGGTTHHVLIFDRSYSMAASLPGGTTPFDRARSLASSLLDRIKDGENPPKVSIVLNGVRSSVPLKESVDLERAKARITALPPPVDVGVDLTAALAEAAELVEESTDGEQRVYLFTDLQLRAFGDEFLVAPVEEEAPALDVARTGDSQPDSDRQDPGEGDETPAADLFEDNATDVIRRIKERAQITVFDVRSRTGEGGTTPNVQITDLRLAQGHAIRNVSVPVIAVVRNRSPEARAVQVTLTVDDAQPIRKSVNVEAGAEAEIEFETSFQALGQRRLEVALDEDDLPNDDRRHAVVTVRDRIRVLVVDDEPNLEPDLRESTHVVEILDPTGGEGPPDLTWFDPTIVDGVEFQSGRARPADFDMVILANVGRLGSEEVVDGLLEAIRSGTGLFAMLGEGIDETGYDVGLYRGGRGPLPMAVRDDGGMGRGAKPGGEEFFSSQIEVRDHPVFRDFPEDVYLEIFESIPIYRYVGLDRTTWEQARAEAERVARNGGSDSGSDPRTTGGAEESQLRNVEVLASIRDGERSPLLVASQYGAGKALFLTSPISRRPDRWNRLDSPVAGLSFLLLWPIAQWLTLPAIDERNVTAGAVLTTALRARPTNLAVVPPEKAGAAKIPVADEPTPLLGDRYALPPFRATEYAGFYAYEATLGEERGSLEEHTELFAVNADPAEGELAYLAHARAKELLGVDRVVSDLPDNAEAATDAGVDELGPMFLLLTLIFLLAEAAMARFVSRGRS